MRRSQLQIEGRDFGCFLLLHIQPRQAVREGVGYKEFHFYPAS